MNEEIKEMNFSEMLFNRDERLLDYINNLQESEAYYYGQYKDYKSRNEKAIEYINENKHLSMFADCREPEEDWNYDLEINPRELLNILQGSDKNI